jgi:nucleoside-diphosphate-sugar epimerase
MTTDRERILVTGAGGFLGACLTHELVSAGHDVHLLFRPGTPAWRLTDVAGRCTVHEADLRDAPGVRAAVAACRPQLVYHLAAHGAYATQTDRVAILESNVLGTAHLLNALEGQDYRALVNVGSSSEYGHKGRPMREGDRLEPRTDYGVAKAAATLLCQSEAWKGRPVTTVRVFSAYGPWEDPRRLVPYVMGCCLRGESPEVGSGRPPRDFVYAGDVVALLQAAAHCPAAHGRILHAGGGRPQTVRDMVETVLAVCGGRVTAHYSARPDRPDEPSVWLADLRETSALTGWRPRHDLKAGVERTWTWFRSLPARAA